MKEIMLKEEFEKAISAYTDKIVEEDSPLVKYVISKSIKTTILNRSGEVIAKSTLAPVAYKKKSTKKPGGQLKTVITPLGRFENIYRAAKAHDITEVAMRGRIRYSRESGSNDYYTEKKV